MRVGLVLPGFSADATDWCIPALRDLVQRLASTDDVRVITLRYPYRAGRYEVFGATVAALGGGQSRGRRSADLWRRALTAIVAEHRRRPFDVLHAYWANETGALAAVAGRLLAVPTIVSIAGGELVALPDLEYGGDLVRSERIKTALALAFATAVTAGSRATLRAAAQRLGRRGGKLLSRLPFGVDRSLFQPGALPPSTAQECSVDRPTVGLETSVHYASANLAELTGSPGPGQVLRVEDLAAHNTTAELAGSLDLPSPERVPSSHTQWPELPQPPVLVHAASLVPVKDQETLLRAAAQLQAGGTPFTLEIAGAGPLEGTLRSLSDRFGLARSVHFRGALAHDDMPGFYRSGDLFVLSSRHEAQCLAALEAAACGLPVVGTHVGVLPELAPDAATTVPAGDAGALAQAIAAILADPHRHEAMRQAGLAKVATHFDLDHCVRRQRQLYERLL